MGKWRVFAHRAASSLIWGGWGFAVPFYFVQDCGLLSPPALFSVFLLNTAVHLQHLPFSYSSSENRDSASPSKRASKRVSFIDESGQPLVQSETSPSEGYVFSCCSDFFGVFFVGCSPCVGTVVILSFHSY